MSTPTPEAIEAAARELWERGSSANPRPWVDASAGLRDRYRMFATAALSAAYPLMVAQAKAEAWDEGAAAAWERSTPTVNGTHYKWRHEGEPLNPYRAATIAPDVTP